MGLPDTSLTPVETVATQTVLIGRLPMGLNVITFPLTAYDTVPVIADAAGQANEKLAPVIVVGSMGSLKLAVTRVLAATPVASRTGIVPITVGAMVSGVPPVVNDQTKSLGRAKPLLSKTVILTVPVQTVLLGNVVPVGMAKVTRLPED